MRERLAALENEMGAAGFWDDPDYAAKVGAEHTRTQRRLDTFTKLQADAGDLDGLAELADEDPDIAGEFARLTGAGVAFTQAPIKAGPVTIAVFADTCGNLIQMHQPV